MISRTIALGRRFFSNVKSTSTDFRYEVLGSKQIGVLTLTNPKKRNSLNQQLVLDLKTQFKSIAEQKPDSPLFTKVVILKAEGTVFSAGHDLKQIKQLQDKNACELQTELFQSSGQLMTMIQSEVPQIVIAQVNNFATAAGLQLVLTCDLVVASKSAQFSTPGIKLGLFCHTPGVALIRAIGNHKKGLEMLVTGDAISAEEAYNFGMINRYVEKDEDLEKETLTLAEKIASFSGEALGLGKKAFYQQKAIGNLSNAYDFTSQVMSNNLGKEDCIEGLASFEQKRHPHFKK